MSCQLTTLLLHLLLGFPSLFVTFYLATCSLLFSLGVSPCVWLLTLNHFPGSILELLPSFHSVISLTPMALNTNYNLTMTKYLSPDEIPLLNSTHIYATTKRTAPFGCFRISSSISQKSLSPQTYSTLAHPVSQQTAIPFFQLPKPKSMQFSLAPLFHSHSVSNWSANSITSSFMFFQNLTISHHLHCYHLSPRHLHLSSALLPKPHFFS